MPTESTVGKGQIQTWWKMQQFALKFLDWVNFLVHIFINEVGAGFCPYFFSRYANCTHFLTLTGLIFYTFPYGAVVIALSFSPSKGKD